MEPKQQASKAAGAARSFTRRTAFFLSTFAIFFVFAWLLYPQSADIHAVPRYSDSSYRCHPDQPVKNVAIIGRVEFDLASSAANRVSQVLDPPAHPLRTTSAGSRKVVSA